MNDDTEPAVWHLQLYQLQQRAPRAWPVFYCPDTLGQPIRPRKNHLVARYDKIYHGVMTRDECKQLLEEEQFGAFFVRDSSNGPSEVVLTIKFDDEIRYFHLFFDPHDNCHYVGDGRFDSVEDLVQDGLITYFVETRGAAHLLAMDNRANYDNSFYKKEMQELYSLQIRQIRPAPRKIVKTNIADEASGERSSSPASSIGESIDGISANSSFPNSNLLTAGGIVGHEEKAHQLKSVTLFSPYWCDLCNHFLFGLKRQAQECVDCGMKAHRRCASVAPNNCLPDMKLMRRVFGVELTTLVIAERSRLPQVLVRLIGEVEHREGCSKEGIYRECGSFELMETIKLNLNKDVMNTNFGKYTDVHIFAGLVKKFFQLLPIPLLHFNLYDDFINSLDPNKQDRILKFQKTLRQLPVAHLLTLEFLMNHLQKISKNSHSTRMDAANLGKVFSPALMRKHESAEPSLERALVIDKENMLKIRERVNRENRVIEFLVENTSLLFTNADPSNPVHKS